MNNNPSLISGKVLTPGGKPIAEARVYFTSGPAALPDISALTDKSGNFSLSAPIEGTYQIGCTADNFIPITVPVEVKRGQNTYIKISLTQ